MAEEQLYPTVVFRRGKYRVEVPYPCGATLEAEFSIGEKITGAEIRRTFEDLLAAYEAGHKGGEKLHLSTSRLLIVNAMKRLIEEATQDVVDRKTYVVVRFARQALND